MSKSLSLYRLQLVDNQILIINNRLAVIDDLLSQDKTLDIANQNLNLASQQFVKFKENQMELEQQLQQLRIKKEQVESNLYDGSIKNPKDLHDLERDVSFLEQNIHDFEEILLDVMEEVEKCLINESRSRELQVEAKIFREEKSQNLVRETRDLQINFDTLVIERQAIIQSLPEDLLEIYESLRKKKGGLAVSNIHENSCDFCGTSLTMSLVQSVRISNEITYCPSCGRILFSE